MLEHHYRTDADFKELFERLEMDMEMCNPLLTQSSSTSKTDANSSRTSQHRGRK